MEQKEESLMKKLKPFNENEHIKFGKDLKSATDLMALYLEKMWNVYEVNSAEGRKIHKELKLLTSQLYCSMDSHDLPIDESERDPNNPCFTIDNLEVKFPTI